MGPSREERPFCLTEEEWIEHQQEYMDYIMNNSTLHGDLFFLRVRFRNLLYDLREEIKSPEVPWQYWFYLYLLTMTLVALISNS